MGVKSFYRILESILFITNGKKQKARPKGINLKVRWMMMMLFLLESEIRIGMCTGITNGKKQKARPKGICGMYYER